MSIKRKALAAAATLTIVGGASSVGTIAAGAATPECGSSCSSVFSRALGSYDQLNFVEAVYQERAEVGQPVILDQATSSDPAEDLMPHGGLVSDFYAAGMVSARVNHHYGNLRAAQLEYAPRGLGTGLCVGLDEAPYQGQGLTLQTCSLPGRTVWIIDTPDSPTTAADGYFPIVSAATRDFVHPFAMDYRRARPGSLRGQIRLRHLVFDDVDHTVPDRQLWGNHVGVVS